MPGGMYSSVNPGILGLEMSLNHHVPPKNPKQQQHPHNPMATYSNREGEYHPQTQQSVKQGYPYAGKARNQTLTLSDDDEPGPENISDDGNMRTSPWQRVKWTDNMVRLLIMVVFYIGDEVGSEGNDPANKKKGGGVLQKKGKWKSVSRAMMEKGFYVSPQQCEDKFNDLNKRYKRVNDILGKGTACRVVENQSLLDSMDHLSPKMKEEVKKLLNSKHLFFREMCAYHNSCGHGSGASGSGAGAGGNQHSPAEVVAEPSHTQFQSQQQRCLHSSENASVMPNLNRGENEGSKLAKGASGEDDDDEDVDEDDGDGDSYEDNDEVVDRGSRGHDHGHEDDNDTDERSSRKRQRNSVFNSPLIQQLNTELMNMLQDGTKSPFEKRQWTKARLMHLEDQRVDIQSQAFELEKQRLKWLKFSSKKEREMEREKLGNEQMRLQNERMVLLIRQKELELPEHHHHHRQQLSSNKMGDPSSITR
ncbi:sequence-specific DNA binding transcription factor [Forsythia ovata]|uniref:Sequence-specific DNA binding transcription factor n=1 Tax=Forsythia ovata TaxID=205694 RepID=A0ABD1WXH4_9LAMI